MHALVGGNGSGKSTLIKVLAGVHRGDPGGRIVAGGAEVASDDVSPGWARAAGLRFVHQDLGLFDELSVAENVLAGGRLPGSAARIRWTMARRRVAETLARLQLDVSADIPVGGLGPAQRALVAVARALHEGHAEQPRVIILDEPTASLPAAEVELLLGVVRALVADGHTVLYVSHRLEEILTVGDQVLALRDGRLVGAAEASELSEQDLVELIAGRPLERVYPTMPDPQPGASVLEVQGLRGDSIRDVSFHVQPREVLGVAGLAGSGRSTLLRLLFGARQVQAGRIAIDGVPVQPKSPRDAMRAGIAYLPEDRAADGGFFNLDVRENLSAADVAHYWSGLRLNRPREDADAKRDIARFSIRAPSAAVPLSLLSGGNQQKVLLARWLRLGARVLLLDEPTHGVDVAARADIYEAVRASVATGACAIVVSSDFEELVRVSDRVLVLAKGRVVAEAAQPHLDRQWVEERAFHVEEAA